MFKLETERLCLRQLTLEDSAFILELLNDPQWIQYIGDKNVRNKSEAESYLEDGPIRMYKELGFGLFCVELQETAKPIGMCGILKRDSLPNVDLGFALLADYRGDGYAQEAAVATLQHARDSLRIDCVDAIASPENEKSIALLERLNFRFKRTIVDGSESLALYSALLQPPAP